MLTTTTAITVPRLPSSAKRRRRPPSSSSAITIPPQPKSPGIFVQFDDRLEPTMPRHSCLRQVVHKSKWLDSSPSNRLAAARMTKRIRRITTTVTAKVIACGCLLSVATTATAFGGAFTPPAPQPPPPPVLNNLSGRQKVVTLFSSLSRDFGFGAGTDNGDRESSRFVASRKFAHLASCRGRSDKAGHERTATPAGWRSSGGRASTNGSSMMPLLSMSAVMEPPTKESTRLPQRTRAPRQRQDRGPLEVFPLDNMSSLMRLISAEGTGRRRADVADAATAASAASAARGSEQQPTISLRINRSRIRPQRYISSSSDREQREPSSSSKAVVRQGNRSSVADQISSPYLIKRESRDLTIRHICDEVRHCKLLSRDEEYKLGTKIQALVHYTAIRNDLRDALGREPAAHEWANSCCMSTADLQERLIASRTAKATMVRSNMRMVIAIAKRYQHLGVPLTDLIQEGSIGLMRAIEKFDPERGFKLSTYSAWWIQQAVFKGIAHQGRVIRLPMHVHNLLVSIKKLEKALMQEGGDIPSKAELAKELEMPERRVKEYLTKTKQTLSFELPVRVQETAVLGDSVQGADPFLPEKETEVTLFRATLREVVCGLPEDERTVVALRFGLIDGKTKTVSQIAHLVNTSTKYVRSVEKKAMRQLRAPHRQRRLRGFFSTARSPLLEELLKGRGAVHQ